MNPGKGSSWTNNCREETDLPRRFGNQSGAFVVVFEGINFVGKTTQSEKLEKWLTSRAYQTKMISLPYAHTGFTDKDGRWELPGRYHWQSFLRNEWRKSYYQEAQQLQKSCEMLILERFAYTYAAYSSADPGYPFEPNRMLDMEPTDIIPDLVFHMKPKHSDLDFIFRRAKSERMQKLNTQFVHTRSYLQSVINQYCQNQSKLPPAVRWVEVNIDQTRSEQDIANEVLEWVRGELTFNKLHPHPTDIKERFF